MLILAQPPLYPLDAHVDLAQYGRQADKGVVTAQDKRKDGRYAGRVRLAIAADRSADSLCGFVESAVSPGSLIVTDDWSGYNSLRTRGYDHHAIAECGDPEVAEEFLPISHLVFCNLKT